MDLYTLLVVLMAICAVTAGGLAWVLHRMGEPLLPPGLARQPPAAVPRPGAPPAPPPAQPPLTAQRQPPPPSPAQPAPVLDRDDPTVRRFDALLADVERTWPAARSVPKSFREHAAMGGELLAIEAHLAAAREQLAVPDAARRAAVAPELERLAARLASIRGDAVAIAAGLAKLTEREDRLTAAALALDDDLTVLERRTPFPPAARPLAGTAADLLMRVRQIPPRSQIDGHNPLKLRLRMAEELLAAVERCRSDLAMVLDPQSALLALLSEPIALSAPPPPASTPPPAPPVAPPPASAAGDAEAAELERRLLRMALGDSQKVMALIALERARAPGASRAELIRNAIERWERDRR